MERIGNRGVAVSLVLVGAGALGACSSEHVPIQEDPVFVAAKRPAAISGGTLLVSKHNGRHIAVASDPDRDRVWVVDLAKKTTVGSVALSDADEPGRLAEDSQGRVHVALRRGGQLLTIDPDTLKVIDRRDVCPAPRGLAYEAKTDAVHVACAGGELVTLPASGGAATRKLRLDRDLRDVVVTGDHLAVTKFRSTEVLVVDGQGKVKSRGGPKSLTSRKISGNFSQVFEPTVAWRTIASPLGGLLMSHQRSLTSSVVIEEGGYGNSPTGCDESIVHTTVTPVEVDEDGVFVKGAAPAIPRTILPVDIAARVDAEGRVSIAVAAAGSDKIIRTTQSLIDDGSDRPDPGCDEEHETEEVEGEPVAVAFWDEALVVQTRDPATIQVHSGASRIRIALPAERATDTGHDMFHRNDGGQISLACASCHPEGRDDGHTWQFSSIGPRRTQNIAGGILDTAPFHWDGDMQNLGMIMHQVFEVRMGGLPKGERQVRAFETWIEENPQLPQSAPEDVAAVARGKRIFERADVGCNGCHSGAKFTNNQLADVGTGKAFQVPSLLGVATRAPFMHDGCAKTLKDRFDPKCGGKTHGGTNELAENEISDLVNYLESL